MWLLVSACLLQAWWVAGIRRDTQRDSPQTTHSQKKWMYSRRWHSSSDKRMSTWPTLSNGSLWALRVTITAHCQKKKKKKQELASEIEPRLKSLWIQKVHSSLRFQIIWVSGQGNCRLCRNTIPASLLLQRPRPRGQRKRLPFQFRGSVQELRCPAEDNLQNYLENRGTFQVCTKRNFRLANDLNGNDGK